MSASTGDDKQQLIDWIEADRDKLVAFLCEFIRRRSPNPPGDTLEAAAHVMEALTGNGLDYRVIDPNKVMPNIVASFEGGSPGRHLALNGHIDVFPVESDAGWTAEPWGAEIRDGKIYGRGAADMKCGTTASLFTYIYLNRLREKLKGRLTLVAVSDEETFGPWGARYLADHHPEVFGDCCLNGEPSGRGSLRFGEKGPLWLEFTVKTAGAHGAYTHASPSATKIAVGIITQLEDLSDMEPADLGNLEALIRDASSVIDHELGDGAARIVRRVTVNPGTISGGVKVNMVAADCTFQVDIRVPNGLTDEDIHKEVARILEAYPQVTYKTLVYNPPAWTDPDTEMARIVRANAMLVSGVDPVPVISLGGTDARLWRYKEVPAIVYGPAPRGMGSVDEHVPIEEFIHVVKCHALSAYDYLTAE
ncbi:M20/M25/M40 family metallo-hydrolase [Oceanibaculum sp.]|uniref:M20/M25/M40 family metallo-hydrolase n=1 Tax=Oceanibaculum sp. TaxID=1903597 RepID=UPI00258CDFB7|nr:M20/M25/M40 family metallo-hydrolase [Oceanibaculum sp.]MCH2394526.1 M20/M25/M40 family metallo-hydrolase [Oceanibaculum sp.]